MQRTLAGTCRGRRLGHQDLTEGAYASGDLDLCHVNKATLPMAERKEIMGLRDAKGGPRNWQVAGMFVDVLGPAESFTRTSFRRIAAPDDRLMFEAMVCIPRTGISWRDLPSRFGPWGSVCTRWRRWCQPGL